MNTASHTLVVRQIIVGVEGAAGRQTPLTIPFFHFSGLASTPISRVCLTVLPSRSKILAPLSYHKPFLSAKRWKAPTSFSLFRQSDGARHNRPSSFFPVSTHSAPSPSRRLHQTSSCYTVLSSPPPARHLLASKSRPRTSAAILRPTFDVPASTTPRRRATLSGTLPQPFPATNIHIFQRNQRNVKKTVILRIVYTENAKLAPIPVFWSNRTTAWCMASHLSSGVHGFQKKLQ